MGQIQEIIDSDELAPAPDRICRTKSRGTMNVREARNMQTPIGRSVLYVVERIFDQGGP